jgi:hypothetical protein
MVGQMLVTSFYDIYGRPDRVMEYIYLFYDLAASGIPMILFTDPSLVSKFRIFPPTLHVIGLPLETFELYQIGMGFTGALPSTRSPEKDTKEFLSLMNTKIEFILRASEICEDNTFVWIDFGILKIVKNRERFINKLRLVNEMSFSKITIPGCWGFGRPFSVDNVNWRFCGGLFVIPREYIEQFYHHSKNVLSDFCHLKQYKLTWETNVWNIIETCAMRNYINWYFADHDDSILLNIDMA